MLYNAIQSNHCRLEVAKSLVVMLFNPITADWRSPNRLLGRVNVHFGG